MPGAFSFDPATNYQWSMGVGGSNFNNQGAGANANFDYNKYASMYGKAAADMISGRGGAAPAGSYFPGAPGGAGGPGAGEAGSSMFGSSFGGKNPFATDAAAKKLRDEFARMRERTKGAVNEDLSSRGIFSSGVGANIMGQEMTQLDLQEGAGLEDLFNRSAQQQMAFQLEQQRMENERRASMYGGEKHRFTGANTGGNPNQQIQDYYNSKDQMASAATGGRGGGGYGSTFGASGGYGSPDQRRAASSSFYKQYGHWPAPNELNDYLSGRMTNFSPFG